jgi:hypothetical protein
MNIAYAGYQTNHIVGSGKVDLPGSMHSFVHICLVALLHLANRLSLDGEICSAVRTMEDFPFSFWLGRKECKSKAFLCIVQDSLYPREPFLSLQVQ